ncbi:MAG: esterase-like activity of phytase family protein, partial [Deinococcales bacterium]|nr:esterase-like activity of phytase family protein [Chitinophagaceae bacterium]
GRLACTIKIYETDISNATDIKSNPSLQKNTAFTPATKKLLLNMDQLGIYTDNVEGMTFGPTLPNGHKTLICVADNNFSPLQKTQFLLFEVIP